MNKLDDIIPPSRRKESGSHDTPSITRSTRPSRFPYATIGTVLFIIALSAAVLFYFSSAKVEVTPNTVSAAVQNSFTASSSSGDFPFQIITAQKVATQSVKSSGTKTVTSNASGPISIYNTQSKTQRLITNTRFATTAGLIFRTRTAISIPAGTLAKPGSVQVTVYANGPGASYNVGPTSFTIPGLAGTPESSAVYARSTVAMSGGASGTVPVIDAATEEEASKSLITALASDLAISIEAQVPSGYVLLQGAAITTYEDLAPTPSSSADMVDMNKQGTVTAVVFPNAALAKAIASSISNLNYQGEPVMLVSTDNLNISSVGTIDPSATSYTFTLAGSASLVYVVDPARISAAVAGKTRTDAQVALTNYPEVKSALIILRPFWRQAFSDDPASIKVTVVAPQI